MAGQPALGRKVSFTSGMLSLTLEDAPDGFLEAAAAAGLDTCTDSKLTMTRMGRRASRQRLNALSESEETERKTPGSERSDDDGEQTSIGVHIT